MEELGLEPTSLLGMWAFHPTQLLTVTLQQSLLALGRDMSPCPSVTMSLLPARWTSHIGPVPGANSFSVTIAHEDGDVTKQGPVWGWSWWDGVVGAGKTLPHVPLQMFEGSGAMLLPLWKPLAALHFFFYHQ